jgi:hypothetical protein
VLEPLAAGGAALVRWRLRTGRTHQIRVHARHLGHPLLGDAAYGGAGGSAVTAIARGKPDRRAFWISPHWNTVLSVSTVCFHRKLYGAVCCCRLREVQGLTHIRLRPRL